MKRINKFTVSEDVKIVLNGEKYLLESGDEIAIVEEDENGWPEDVGEGDLRERMDLNKDQSLEDQTTPENVAEFFDNTDAEGRGMVMFAVNSNKDNDFWKKVGDLVGDEEGEGEEE